MSTTADNQRIKATGLSDWLLSRGISSITTAEVARLLSIPKNQVAPRLAAPRTRGEFVSPARGLYIPVPPEYRSWGAPPALEIIDRLMEHFNILYYVGWLSSAALLGASHHAPQVFQVATARHVRGRTVGRSKMQFIVREQVNDLPVVLRQTRNGTARIASRATTLLDIASDPGICGGLNNVANLIIELCETDEKFIPELLATASFYPTAAIRRLGWIMESFLETKDVDALRELAWTGAASSSKLDPASGFSGNLDKRWNIYVNRRIEPDV